MKIFAFICALLAAFSISHAQIIYEAPLPDVRQETYYDLVLSPEVTSRLTSQAENLRLLDSNGVEIPYLFDSQEHAQLDVNLKWYPVRGERYRRRRYTRSVFENPRRDAIDEMVLKVRNADVTQHFWLSGSDDLNRWHIIKEDFVYDRAYDLASTYNLITLQFPPVDYRYYKVEIRHYWREPIEIMGAGYYKVDAQEGRYLEVPGVRVTQTDDPLERRSHVEVDLGGMHYVDRLHLQVDGPERYHRNALLEGEGLHREVVLSSKEVTRFSFEGLRANKLRFTIENLDDQPVKVVRARAYQLRRSVTARMRPGMEGRAVVYREGERAPAYDLVHFAGELPRRRPVVRLDSLQALPPTKPTAIVEGEGMTEEMAVAIKETPGERLPKEGDEEKEKGKDSQFKEWVQRPVVLWSGIIVIALAMVWLSVRTLRENGGEEAD